MCQIIGSPLFSKPFDISRDQFIIFRMGSQREACLFHFFQSTHKLGIIRACQAFKLSIPSFRRFVEEGFISYHSLMRQWLYLFRKFAAGRSEKAEVDTAPFFAEIHAVVKNFRIVLRWNGNRVLKKSGTSASRSGSRPYLECLPLRMARITVMNMRVNAAGKHVPAIRIYRFQAFRKTARLCNHSNFTVADSNIGFSKTAFYENQSVYNCKL